jgi:hypothetical protein
VISLGNVQKWHINKRLAAVVAGGPEPLTHVACRDTLRVVAQKRLCREERPIY